MRHRAMRKILGAALLIGPSIAAAADDGGMITVPGAAAVKWVQAPPSLPRNVDISLLAGDPAKEGPFTLRVRVPADTVLAPHTHAKLESVTVLSGDIHHEMGETLDKTKGALLSTGGFVSLPADMPHSLWTSKQTAILQVTGVGPFDLHYIDPKDDPRNDKSDPRNRK